MTPVALHVIRPYESEEEFLEAEAWTIEPRAMLLLEQLELEHDASVVFDVGLTNGVKMMRAEARVVGFVPAEDGAPSALKVRFRRYGSQTKAFIERAVQMRQEQLAREAQRPSSLPPRSTNDTARVPSAPPPRVPSAPPPRVPSAPPRAASSPPRVPSSPPPKRSVPPQPELDAVSLELRARPLLEPSGVHRRPISEVATPPNRDELLARLRARARNADPSMPSKSGTS